jgi:CheY-like chemotaxis protein
MTRTADGTNFADCLTVGQAANYLGVSTATLRNWDRSGKLRPRRHPQNGYRIYLHEDLDAVLQSARLSKSDESTVAPRIDWSAMRHPEHFVQFYENDNFLVESVAGFIGAALGKNHSGIVIATPEHRAALEHALEAGGTNVAAAINSGRYIARDAASTLAKVMTDGSPDPALISEHLGPVVAQAAKAGSQVHVFGEMVALLWADGNRQAAIQMEELWNELGHQQQFALFCAYPMSLFADTNQAVPFNGICACHTRVIPAESYSENDNDDDRLRAVAMLQQKAQSLEAEIKHREAVEAALSQREREFANFVEKSAPLPAAKGDATQRRVLVVDDNHDSGHTLSMLLKVNGHDVRTARDGLEAIEMTTEFNPEVILMDIGMPKLDGYDTTLRIRQLPGGDRPMIIALTGWGRPDDRQKSTEAGFFAHLVKPVEYLKLQELLNQAPRISR